ncbi:ankyrin repeat-containing domain protein [Fusarium avenaceum]|nr:ankyrin repeat-containing domain protein [Fusarium avenaceum]
MGDFVTILVHISATDRKLLLQHTERTKSLAELYVIVLQLITHANRPLRLLEIADCIKVTKSEYGKDTGTIKALISKACGTLLDVRPDQTVRIAHDSLQDYLLTRNRIPIEKKIPVFEPGPTHDLLANLFLSYLHASSLETYDVVQLFPGFEWDTSEEQELPPFLSYAATNWHIHTDAAAKHGVVRKETNTQILSLLTTPRYVDCLAWLNDDIKWKGASQGQKMTPETEALLFSIRLGVTSFVEAMLRDSDGMAIMCEGTRGTGPPLHQAVLKGNVDIVRLLTRYGANLTQFNSQGATPLHLAVGFTYDYDVVKINPDIVQHLLEAGADPWQNLDKNKEHQCSTDTFPSPAMKFALRSGNEGIAKLFLPYIKSEIEAKQAFAWAANTEIIRSILNLGLMDINGYVYGQPLLFSACLRQDPEIISLLLKAASDPKLLFNDYYTVGANVLHALASPSSYYRHGKRGASEDVIKECFRLILAAGANVNKTDQDGNTPLHKAESRQVAQLLLNAGADATVTNRNGEAPIHVAYNVDIIKVLLRKTSIDLRDRSGKTVLLRTLSGGTFPPTSDITSVRDFGLRILDLGANASVVDRDGNSALHYLVRRGGLAKPQGKKLLERLIKDGADPYLHNARGQTAIDRLGISRMEDLEAFLEATKLDMNAVDNHGRTFLFSIIDRPGYQNGHLEAFIGLMSKAGARFDITDQRGWTIVHAALRRCRTDGKILRLLVEHGADPKQTGMDGNTLWHDAASQFATRWVSPQLFHDITALGIDPRKANKLGRLPLHILCSCDQWWLELGIHAKIALDRGDDAEKEDKTTVFDFMLQQGPEDVNCMDHDGIAPLHLVSTFSTDLTRRLLEAGADPTLSTHENLNVFHLASRCRQSNTIGLLIDWFKKAKTAEDLHTAINAKDSRGRTPLYYACASGIYQSVQFLIESGARVDLKTYDGSALNGCVDFEEEVKNWVRYSSTREEQSAGGVLIDDKSRPKVVHSWTSYRVERLDDILKLLTSNVTTSNSYGINRAITVAMGRNLDYTTEQLMRAQRSLGFAHSSTCEVGVKLCLDRRAKELARMMGNPDFANHVDCLMSSRFYDAVPSCVAKYSPELKDLHDVLIKLSKSGFAQILDNLLTPEVVSRLENELDLTTVGVRNGRRMASLLVAGCESEEPNMPVIQLLVKKGARLDCLGLPVDHHYRGRVPETSLHTVVRGEHHPWWHTAQALPFILEQGGTLEVKDANGLTPLNASLENMIESCWNSKATEMLLKAGADPSSVDSAGKSCLARAISNTIIHTMLIQHGAVTATDHSSLTSCILAKDVNMLERMLASGADPNVRKVGEEREAWISADGRHVGMERKDPDSQDELFPLELAVNEISPDTYDPICERMIQLLLEHGADPNARYSQTTVAHRLQTVTSGRAQRNCYLDIILQYPRLDINLKTGAGNPLLRSAYSMEDLRSVDILLERGADVRIRDGSGRNLLHFGPRLLDNKYGDRRSKKTHDYDTRRILIKRWLGLAPDLLNQVDKNGKTPLHYAMGDGEGPGEEVEIFLAAGADVCAQDENGDTPLHSLCKGRWGLVTDENGNTAWGGPPKRLLELLLSKGADINARNKAGETPVFSYFREGSGSKAPGKFEIWADSDEQAAVDREPMLWALFDELGVDWTAVNGRGQSLLHIVATKNYTSIGCDFEPERLPRFKFLVGKGLDVMKEDSEYRTVLDVAAANKAEGILEWFTVE